MDFFHLFFEKYFITGGKYFTYNKAYDMVNGDASFAVLSDSLKADPVLRDPEVRELLILDGLKDLYNISGFKRNRIIALINEVTVNGSTKESRMLAVNLLSRLKRLQPGSPAPGFTLPGVSSDRDYSLAEFSGKMLYLAFFDSGNPASQSELGLATDFYKDYKDKVAFVAISVDEDLVQLKAYLSRAELPWLVLHYNGNLDLLEDFDANTFPYFLLINGKSQIIRCPAPSPSENIQKLFDSN
jgi:thiol-disulfide isomerase/thioredoxin